MEQVIVASLMITGSVVTHLIGLLLMRRFLIRQQAVSEAHDYRREMPGFLAVAWALVVLHTIEIYAWAKAYQWVGALPNFETAIFFSTATYATIGGGSVVLPEQWRVLGAIEGAIGMLLLGWSTAFFLSVVNRIMVMPSLNEAAARKNSGPE